MDLFDHVRLIAAWYELLQNFRAVRVQTLTDTGQRYPARRHQLIERWRQQMGYVLP